LGEQQTHSVHHIVGEGKARLRLIERSQGSSISANFRKVVDGLQPAVTCKNFTKQVTFMRRHLVDDTASPFAQFLRLFAFS
jgi:hypothetical protein